MYVCTYVCMYVSTSACMRACISPGLTRAYDKDYAVCSFAAPFFSQLRSFAALVVWGVVSPSTQLSFLIFVQPIHSCYNSFIFF